MSPIFNPSKKMQIIFIFLVLNSISSTIAGATAGAAHDRRTLHQPFFPQDSPIIPPVQPPSQTPAIPPVKLPAKTPAEPPSSDIPFLTTPISTPPPENDQPFFRPFPSPPPPPPPPPSSSSSSASFPANISSLNLPTSPKPNGTSSKLIPVAITLCIAAVIVLSIVVIFGIQKRRRYHKDSESFTDEKGYNNGTGVGVTAASNGGGGGGNSYNRIPKLNRPSQTSSEFLYLGTLVNSHGGIDSTGTSTRGGESSVLQKVGSPELRPLPPLSGGGVRSGPIIQNVGFENSEVESEQFHSPKPPVEMFGGAGKYHTRKSVGSGSGSSSSYSSSSSGSPARSISLSISPPVSLSPKKSRMKPPEIISLHTAPPPSRPAPPPPPPPRLPSFIPSPDVGLSKNSLESSPRLSNSSDDQSSSPAPAVATHTEIPYPKLQPLNPPVLIKPSKPVLVTTQQPLIPENLETKTQKPKLKPLHWDKVKASSDHEMVWDHLKSSSFKLNEEMIETLFIVKPQNGNNLNQKSTFTHPILASSMGHENQVLDPKRSQNIAIALRALNVTIEEVCDALLEGNVETLGIDLLETLLKMAPTKEEERKLKDHHDESPVKLGPAEKFLKTLLDVPFAFKRIGAMLYVSNFDSEIEYLKNSFLTLEAACEELRNNRMFLKLLEAVLKTGNRMNIGTNRGDAQAFKLDTLLKLIDIKGADGKTTLLHFVVQEIIRIETARNPNQTTFGLRVLSGLGSDLSNVKKAAAMDSEALNRDVARLSNGIANVAEVVRLVRLIDDEKKTKFSDSMNVFLKTANEEVIKIQNQERVTLSLVKELTEYFHGNSVKEEAHPLRIFMVVRDFLNVLDRVCKEVGPVNDRVTGPKFPGPVISNPVFDGLQGRRRYSSSDDESSGSM